MKTFAPAVVAAALLATAVAQPASAASTMKAASLKCPTCTMTMPNHKTSTMTVPVYIKGKKAVFYCCPQCPSGKAAAAYWAKHHKPMPAG